MWLRSGCDLAKVTEVVGLERPGGAVEELPVTAEMRSDAFHELRDRATAAGIAMGGDTIALTPIPALAEAIKFAVTSGTQGDEG